MNKNIFCSRNNKGPRVSAILEKEISRHARKMEARSAHNIARDSKEKPVTKKSASSFRGRVLWERLLTRGMRVNQKAFRANKLSTSIKRAIFGM